VDRRFVASLLLVPVSLACSLLTVARPAPAPRVSAILGDDPNLTILAYEIEGTTAAELRRQMDLLGPVDPGGYRGDAMTTWYVSWDWPGYGSPFCTLSRVETSYTITVTFPHWDPPPGVPSELLTRWDAYTQALARHERLHIDNLMEHYPDVLPAIQNSSCLAAETAAQDVVAQIRAEDAAIDERTDHGKDDGAVFP
jgi:predicted secreted Zn-dependent protease